HRPRPGAAHHRGPIAIDQAGLHRAMRDQRKIRFGYRDTGGRVSERLIRPLVMAFYGPVWVLAGWCEDREAFRVFRLERMTDMT
ncbi:helix-turn-helix transcriptional regulator, partial [Enterobacter ludwigii]|uniref:helix-turn-helix transcriptional regulator n=1 Tax=Enterobacter ludwigii TaxID=299767 RepID=UPI0013D6EA7A